MQSPVSSELSDCNKTDVVMYSENKDKLISETMKESKEEGQMKVKLNIQDICYVLSPFQETPPLPHFWVLVLTLGWGLFALWTFLLLLFG